MADDSLHQKMLSAIGQVAMDSGHASMALQQMIEVVTGTGLMYFTMRDSPLGNQLSAAKTMVEHAGTNEWISHPPVDTEVRDLILSTLSAFNFLRIKRNRIIHDIWMPAPADQYPDGIHSFPATRWGKESVGSTVRTFRQIAGAFFKVAVTLNRSERALVDLRKMGKPGGPILRDDALWDFLRHHEELTTMVNEMKSGRLEGWRWSAKQPSSMPSTGTGAQ